MSVYRLLHFPVLVKIKFNPIAVSELINMDNDHPEDSVTTAKYVGAVLTP
jgi:hypothetical protein